MKGACANVCQTEVDTVYIITLPCKVWPCRRYMTKQMQIFEEEWTRRSEMCPKSVPSSQTMEMWIRERTCLCTHPPTSCVTAQEELETSVEHPGYHTAPLAPSENLSGWVLGYPPAWALLDATAGFQTTCEQGSHPSDLVQQMFASFLFCFVAQNMAFNSLTKPMTTF